MKNIKLMAFLSFLTISSMATTVYSMETPSPQQEQEEYDQSGPTEFIFKMLKAAPSWCFILNGNYDYCIDSKEKSFYENLTEQIKWGFLKWGFYRITLHKPSFFLKFMNNQISIRPETARLKVFMQIISGRDTFESGRDTFEKELGGLNDTFTQCSHSGPDKMYNGKTADYYDCETNLSLAEFMKKMNKK